MSTTTIDALAKKVITGAALAMAQGVPRAVAAEAFYRAALVLLISEVGIDATVATLRDSAERMAADEDEFDEREISTAEIVGHA